MCHFHQKPLKTPPTQPRKCDILLLEVHRIWIKGSGEKKNEKKDLINSVNADISRPSPRWMRMQCTAKPERQHTAEREYTAE